MDVAKAATANIYQPILIGTNVLYLLFLIGFQQAWTVWLVLGMVLNWGLQAFAYLAILDQATNNQKNNNNNNNKELVGGVHLDLLALTVLIQFGSTLHSTKWFYLLAMVPLWGGWMFYSTFIKGRLPTSTLAGGGQGGTGSTSSGVGTDDKRQKRAQKRAQKWS